MQTHHEPTKFEEEGFALRDIPTLELRHPQVDLERVETLQRENKYMGHILGKVKEHFQIESEASLLDVNIFLNKLNNQRKK